MSAELSPEISNHTLPEGLYVVPEAAPVIFRTELSERIGGATVKFTLLQHESPIERTPTLIIPGFCAPASAYERFAQNIAAQGRNVVYGKSPRTQSILSDLQTAHRHDVLRLQAQANWGISRVAMRFLEAEQVDVIAHSMGFPIGIKYAAHKPDMVRSIVSTGGAGMDYHQSMRKRVGQGTKVIARSALRVAASGNRTAIPKLALEASAHIVRQPHRTIREGCAVANLDITPELTRARDAGVRLGMMLFEKDEFFKPDTTLEHSGHFFDETAIIPNAYHNYPLVEPEQHALHQATMFSKLNSLPARTA